MKRAADTMVVKTTAVERQHVPTQDGERTVEDRQLTEMMCYRVVDGILTKRALC